MVIRLFQKKYQWFCIMLARGGLRVAIVWRNLTANYCTKVSRHHITALSGNLCLILISRFPISVVTLWKNSRHTNIQWRMVFTLWPLKWHQKADCDNRNGCNTVVTVLTWIYQNLLLWHFGLNRMYLNTYTNTYNQNSRKRGKMFNILTVAKGKGHENSWKSIIIAKQV